MTKKACAMHPAVFLTMPRISPSTICMTYANTAREALFFFFSVGIISSKAENILSLFSII